MVERYQRRYGDCPICYVGNGGHARWCDALSDAQVLTRIMAAKRRLDARAQGKIIIGPL